MVSFYPQCHLPDQKLPEGKGLAMPQSQSALSAMGSVSVHFTNYQQKIVYTLNLDRLLSLVKIP